MKHLDKPSYPPNTAMIGHYIGFTANLKNKVPGVLAVCYVIHHKHLVARCLSEYLHTSLQNVIVAVFTAPIPSTVQGDNLNLIKTKKNLTTQFIISIFQ